MSLYYIPVWTSMISICSIFTLWRQRHQIIFHPHKEISATPRDVGVAYHDVFLHANGGDIHGWYLQPDINSKPDKLIILSHGNAGNLSNRIAFAEFWQTHLKSHGYAMYIYDYPGFGLSTAASVDYPTIESCKKALKSVIRFFQGNTDDHMRFRTQDMILYGESVGGAISAVVAASLASKLGADHVTFDKVILQSTFSSLNDMASFVSSFLALITSILPEELDVVKACKKMKQEGLNVVVMHSPTDEVVPFTLFQKLKPFATTTVVLNGGHNDTLLDERISSVVIGTKDGKMPRNL